MTGPLGLRKAPDDRHVRLYRLTAETMPTISVPVVIGINWYHAFDDPWKDSQGHHYLVQPGGSLGSIRGGHCVCLRPPSIIDRWYPFYDQGKEGACVGFGWSRFCSLMNRERYNGFKLYAAAQAIDDWDDTPPESGTSVRAGGEVLRTMGHWKTFRDTTQSEPNPGAGIIQYRWATSVEEIAACLSVRDAGKSILKRGWVPILNSWGLGYPREVRADLDILDRVCFREDGEAAMATDRPAPGGTS